MFEKNKNLRSKNETVKFTQEMLEEYMRCSEDILYFASKYYYITTIDYGKIIIPLWDFQKKVLLAMQNPPNGKRHTIMNFSRQSGKTTLSSIFLLHQALFKTNQVFAILANREKTAIEILRRIKDAYEMLPLWLQQGVVEWAKGKIALENGCVILASSTSSTAIRGYTINCVTAPTKVTVRNKKTGKIEEMSIKELEKCLC
jgi:hypothetical protein